MAGRTLTITVSADWRNTLRVAGQRAQADQYQGESLNFESPAAFFGRLSAKRWSLVQSLMHQGEIPLDKLSRQTGRNLADLQTDVSSLEELGLVERKPGGKVLCPFADIHVDMHLREAV